MECGSYEKGMENPSPFGTTLIKGKPGQVDN
jgi:hypothetical protein